MNKYDKLVMMANQIAAFFATQRGEHAVSHTAAHINSFWDPRMRADIRTHLTNGGAGLSTLARAAVATMAVTTEVSPAVATDGSDAG